MGFGTASTNFERGQIISAAEGARLGITPRARHRQAAQEHAIQDDYSSTQALPQRRLLPGVIRAIASRPLFTVLFALDDSRWRAPGRR